MIHILTYLLFNYGYVMTPARHVARVQGQHHGKVVVFDYQAKEYYEYQKGDLK